MTVYSWDSGTGKYVSSSGEVMGGGKVTRNSSGGNSGGGNGGNSGGNSGGGTYRGAGGSGLTNTDWASKYGNSSVYKSLVDKYGANNVHDAFDYISTGGGSKSQVNYLLTGGGSINKGGHINYNANGSQLNGPRDDHGFHTSISSMQFGQGTPDDYQNARNTSLGNYYSNMGKYDYNTIYNDLSKNKGFASASAEDQKSTINKIMEKAANASGGTLTSKNDQQIAAEQVKENNFDEVDKALNDMFNGLGEEDFDYYDEAPNMDEQLYPDWRDDFNDRLDRVEQIYERDENTIKKTVPEERDTSYDYNTYWQENLAPDNNYENGVSKNEKAEQVGLEFKEKYEDPITQSLTELGLLTPNEQAATQEGVEEQVMPVEYNNPEEIVSSFSDELNKLQENTEGLSREEIVNLYKQYKKQLYEYAKRNKLTNSQYQEYLGMIRNNELLQNNLKDNNIQ